MAVGAAVARARATAEGARAGRRAAGWLGVDWGRGAGELGDSEGEGAMEMGWAEGARGQVPGAEQKSRELPAAMEEGWMGGWMLVERQERAAAAAMAAAVTAGAQAATTAAVTAGAQAATAATDGAAAWGAGGWAGGEGRAAACKRSRPGG